MNTNEKKKRRDEEKFWHKLLRNLYSYRGWWVDGPTITLLFLYHWDFFSKHAHPVPEEFPEAYWIILGLYILVKEGVRWKLHDIQSRKGSIIVAFWLASMLFFFVWMAWHPSSYAMPYKMVESTLIVLGGFVGVLPFKFAFFKKFPKIAEALLPPNQKISA